MRAYYAALICVLAVLLLAGAVGVQAQEDSPWQPAPLAMLDPAPWRTGSEVRTAAMPDEGPVFLEIRATRDTFVASNYPFDTRSFERETSLWFGTDTTLGHLRTLLRWDIPRIPGAQFVAAAVYLPIAGANVNLPMEASAYRITSSWPWDSVHWLNQPPTAGEPIARFTVGAEPGWLWFDVSALAAEWWQNPYSNDGIQLRGPETTANVAKGMFSREAGNDAPVPTLVIAYMPDRTPPTCSIHSLPKVSPVPVRITFDCSDDKAGMASVEIEYWLLSGDGPTNGNLNAPIHDNGEHQLDVFGVLGNNTYSFRLRAIDKAGNVSDWTSGESAVTTIEGVPPRVTVTGDLKWFYYKSGEVTLDRLYTLDDPGPITSGISRVQKQYQDLADGIWHDIDSPGLVLTPGHRYLFRVQAVDRANNRSPWMLFGPATAYVHSVSGQILDARGQPLAGTTIEAVSAGLNQSVTDETGSYRLYLSNTNESSLRVATPGLTFVGNAAIPRGNYETVLPSYRVGRLENAISDGGFDEMLGTRWRTSGTRAEREQRFIVDSNHSLRLGAPGPVMVSSTALYGRACAAAGSDGTLHLVWVSGSHDSGTGTFYYTSRASGSAAWDAPVPIASTKRWGPPCQIGVAADGAVGLAYVDEPGGYVIRFRHKPLGGNWGPEETTPLFYYGYFLLAVGPGGRAEVFSSYNAPTYTRREPSGQWLSPRTLPGSATNDYVSQDILYVDRHGRRHYVWKQGFDAVRPLLYSFSPDGVSWSAPRRLVDNLGPGALRVTAAPDGQIAVVWPISDENYNLRFSYILGQGETWSAPAMLNVLTVGDIYQAFDIGTNGQGKWYFWYQPIYSDMDETLYAGMNLQTLALQYTLPKSSHVRSLIGTPTAIHLLRHFEIGWEGRTLSSLVELPAQPAIEAAFATQTIVVPDQVYSTLSWFGLPGRLDTRSEGGRLSVELVDSSGVLHELATMITGETDNGWADLSPWAGKKVTLTFRFDPRGDPTAWAWVDNVHLSGIPLNTAVSLARNNFPKAGQPFTFTLTVANRRPYPLNIPVELNWPADWPLQTCTASGAVSPGVARFEVPLDGRAERSITCTVDIPPADKPFVQTISATIGQIIADQDYTPADNRATLTLIVNGRPAWLPLIAR